MWFNSILRKLGTSICRLHRLPGEYFDVTALNTPLRTQLQWAVPIQKRSLASSFGCTALVCLGLLTPAAYAESASLDTPSIESPGFDDSPTDEPVENPDWFKLSFLDLKDDLLEAEESGKRGVLLYFGQKHCPYCKAFIEVNFGRRDIVQYTQTYFDVIALDVRGNRLVTDVDGRIMTEKVFSIEKQANFTPSLIFYDLKGRETMRLVGYYPPYKFQAALEYVADGHHETEDFRDFLARAESPPRKGNSSLNQHAFFTPQPYILDRSATAAQKPLLVFFEQKDCYACDVLHAGPFLAKEASVLARGFDMVQLDIWQDTPVITPSGKRTTARKWAEDLGLFYTPTLIIYDERGKEIIRIDSLAHFHRLKNTIHFVLTKAYKKYGSFQAWRQQTIPAALQVH